MTMRWKAIPWAVAVVLLGGTLVGARLLDTVEGQQPTDVPGPTGGAVTVLGTVASDPPEVAVGPPALAALVTVEAVLIEEGQTIAVGTPLVQFDATLVRNKLPQAEAELAAAKETLTQAIAQKQGHALKIAGQELNITTLRQNLAEGEASYKIAVDQFDRILDTRDLNGQVRTPAEKATERNENLELRKANTALVNLRAKIAGEELTLRGLQVTPIDSEIRAAEAQVAAIAAKVAEAQAAIDAHTLKARTAGVVERLYATAGQTFGPATRSPVLWIVPDGKRTVRAEVEPEFAPRVVGREGVTVTITDSNNFAITYVGVVRRVGTSFLPKRSQQDALRWPRRRCWSA